MGLIEQIRDLSDEAACEFEQAEITNDNEIQELTREDLNDLLPGRKRLKIRKKIFEIISKSKKDTVKPINIIIEELRGFLTADLMKSALDPGGVLYEYLPILRDLHKQLDKALHFFEAHIELLESYSKGVTNGDHMKQGSSTDSPPGGSNLGQGQHSGTDIEAAMRQVHGDKDAILVVMHHTFDPNYVISQSSSPRYRRVVEEVHVLFHDTLGLQRCETNVKAVSLIYHALKKYTT